MQGSVELLAWEERACDSLLFSSYQIQPPKSGQMN